MRHWIWFSDVPVLMIFEDPELYSLVRPLLDELRHEPGSTAQFTCVFETCRELHNPSDATLVHDGPLGPTIPAPAKILTAAMKEWLLVEGAGSVEVDSEKRITHVRIVPEADPSVTSTIALYAIDAALSATSQHLLHGAGLILPSGKGAVLLFAPSGAGKTTTSIALALDGFGMLTDDALVLRQDRAIWGLPRVMKVHWRTVELLPALKSLFGPIWNDEGEQVLTRHAFSEIGAIASHTSSPIVAVLLLGERSHGAHVIEKASKAEILLALANDNIGTSRIGVLRRQVLKMEAVADLLNYVPAARFHVGASLSTLGSTVIEYCEQNCRQTQPLIASA
jgi:hypothetical protein